ncbi:uncharacterized protein L201_003842 [Kwoniella dendrophila CBS 6074]|uniref:PiggyBac transposable element-derived protein domain-containing protein n=1 Tax=Kwoniella dendrophila CBS 6074 TaxID=1295534 RepID=A0AAX4JU99_9TREE
MIQSGPSPAPITPPHSASVTPIETRETQNSPERFPETQFSLQNPIIPNNDSDMQEDNQHPDNQFDDGDHAENGDDVINDEEDPNEGDANTDENGTNATRDGDEDEENYVIVTNEEDPDVIVQTTFHPAPAQDSSEEFTIRTPLVIYDGEFPNRSQRDLYEEAFEKEWKPDVLPMDAFTWAKRNSRGNKMFLDFRTKIGTTITFDNVKDIRKTFFSESLRNSYVSKFHKAQAFEAQAVLALWVMFEALEQGIRGRLLEKLRDDMEEEISQYDGTLRRYLGKNPLGKTEVCPWYDGRKRKSKPLNRLSE